MAHNYFNSCFCQLLVTFFTPFTVFIFFNNCCSLPVSSSTGEESVVTVDADAAQENPFLADDAGDVVNDA